MKNKTDKIIDGLYENRKPLIRYFICALIASIIKYAVTFLISGVVTSGGDIIAFMVWAIVFYPLLKFFVFKWKAEHIFELLRQMIIYIVCVTALWVINTVLGTIVYTFTNSGAGALTVAGIFTEVICLWLMFKIAFKN